MVGRRLGVVVIGLLCLTVGVAGCAVGGGSSASNESAGAGQVVWDFRSPLTPQDLGSRSKVVRQVDGPTEVRVVFPSGREIDGVWELGVRAEALEALGNTDGPAQPVDRIMLFESSATDIETLRASAQRFVAEWGSASNSDGTIDDFIEQTAQLHAQAGTAIGQTYPIGDNVFAFDAPVSDAIQPTWSPRFIDDVVTIRVLLKFDPAPQADSASG